MSCAEKCHERLKPCFAKKAMQNTLANKRQVILILRLTLDANGQLVHGEVVELEGKLIGRFIEWHKLPEIVRAALKLPQEQAQDVIKIERHESDTQPFIVQIGFKESAEEAERNVWRGYITYVPTGQRCDLTDLSGIITFITSYL